MVLCYLAVCVYVVMLLCFFLFCSLFYLRWLLLPSGHDCNDYRYVSGLKCSQLHGFGRELVGRPFKPQSLMWKGSTHVCAQVKGPLFKLPVTKLKVKILSHQSDSFVLGI